MSSSFQQHSNDSSSTLAPSTHSESKDVDQNEKTIKVMVSEPPPPKEDDVSPNYLPPDKLIIVFISLCLALFVSSLDQTIVSVALPTIARQFDSVPLIPWVGTAYLLSSTSFQPLYGALSDIFGRRSTLIFAIGVFMVGSILCGAANSMIFLIIARGIAGVGGGGIVSLVMITVSDIVPMRERGRYQGLIGGVFSLSSVIGPLLGGLFTDKASWRWAFYVNIPFTIIAIIACAIFLRLKPTEGSWKEKVGRIDFPGSLSIIAFVICLLLPLEWGGSSYAWNSPVVISLFCVAIVLLGVTVFIEGKVASSPIIPGRLLTYRTPLAGFILNFFLGICFFGQLYYLPIYFQTVWNESATIAGLEVLPLVGGLVLMSIVAGQITSKLGVVRPQVWLGLSFVIVGCGLLSLLKVDSTRSSSIPFLLIFGMGLGLSMQSILLACQAAVKHADMARVTSTLSFTRSMGGVMGIAIAGSIFDNKLSQGLEPILAQLSPQQLSVYAVEGSDFFRQLGGPLLDQFLQAYMDSLHLIFLVMIPFGGAALIASFFLEHNSLTRRTEVSSSASIEEKVEQPMGDVSV